MATPVSNRSVLKSIVSAALLLAVGAPLLARATDASTTDQARAWAALQRMKPMDVMHMVDADKKGYVTKEDFMKFQAEFYARMDQNHDGQVDAQEWMGKSAGGAAKK
jgi:hypothetical protein